MYSLSAAESHKLHNLDSTVTLTAAPSLPSYAEVNVWHKAGVHIESEVKEQK